MVHGVQSSVLLECCTKNPLPEQVLALVDEQAKREAESRSGLLARAVLEYIGRNSVA